MKKFLIIDNKKIEYQLERKNIKNINIRIKPDKEIYVSAPKSISISKIESVLIQKHTFIFGALRKIEQRQNEKPNTPKFIDGKSLSILGESYILLVKKSAKNFAYIQNNNLVFEVFDTENSELKQKVYDEFLLSITKENVIYFCNQAYKDFEDKIMCYPQIKFRKMKSRYGSCNYAKYILCFNTLLATFPKECIKMVVYHEFSHFLSHNHSKEFYNILDSFIPNRKELNKILNRG